MKISGFETQASDEDVKKAFGFTDMVHRDIEGQIVEINNPQTIEQYVSEYLRGVFENKLLNKDHCC